MEEQVILVNERDEPIGLMGKMEAHQKGLLHRAFSVFVFNSKKEVLLQQRAACNHQRVFERGGGCPACEKVGEGKKGDAD